MHQVSACAGSASKTKSPPKARSEHFSGLFQSLSPVTRPHT
jgi:hypothetical protein